MLSKQKQHEEGHNILCIHLFSIMGCVECGTESMQQSVAISSLSQCSTVLEDLNLNAPAVIFCIPVVDQFQRS